MKYITLSDLSDLIRNNIQLIPHDIDLVVGVPRSGMIPAYMIALFLNKRVSDLNSFLNGHIVDAGERKKYIKESNIHKILVVDDSVQSGNAMIKAKSKLNSKFDNLDCIFFAPIVSTIGKEYVDLWIKIIDEDRIFEWNLFHHSFIQRACLDIDGVLNVDPEIDDDGLKYEEFLLHAIPKFLPTVTIGTLVTCRLEKYRVQTEQWLKKYNIRYNQLIMLDLPNKSSRVAWGRHGEYKAECYMNNRNAIIFIESSKSQAEIIAKVSGKPVICVETNTLVQYELELVNTKSDSLKSIIRQKYPRLFYFFKHLIKTNK